MMKDAIPPITPNVIIEKSLIVDFLVPPHNLQWNKHGIINANVVHPMEPKRATK